MSFSALSAAWLFLLLVPLVVFYFLKLRRPRIEIPSLFLWRQVLADQRVNSPFQRFKRNLLLLLQILLLALLVLAAMQPFLRREAARADRLPILIDVSASMAALDRAGGRTRLAEVKERVREVIDGLPAGQEISLIAFSKTARRLTPFTGNPRELRSALAALETEDLPGDLGEALRVTQALARTAPFDRLLLFSDGNFPAKTNLELPFRIDFQRVTPATSNYGIIAASARRAPGERWEIFLQLAASAGAESTTATLELLQDGAVVARETVALTKGATPRLAFTLASGRASLVQARLLPQDFDALAADNEAWLALPAARPLVIHLAPRLASYRQALAGIDGLTIFPREGEPPPASYDLVITDRAEDLTLPARLRFSIGLVPAELQPLVTIENKNSQTIDWRRDAPLLQHVALNDVLFMDEPVTAADVDDASFANLGYEILARGPRGPLIVARGNGTATDLALLFHTDRSTLPYRVGFPILCANLVQLALAQSGLAEVQAARTGVLPPLELAPNQTFRVEGPGGLRRDARSDERGQLGGLPAPKAGEYRIAGPGAVSLRVGASLLTPAETALAAVEQIEFSDHLTVTAATAEVAADRTLWRALACAAFVVLLVEWWWYQRRGAVNA